MDQWARWLLERRHGGDPELLRRQLEHLGGVRDRVLANADVRDGEVLLDVGCGDGLIGFGALERVGVNGRVIVSDISDDLLEHVAGLAAGIGVRKRCTFVNADAADLSAIADASVDVVTTRSVLIYVRDKAAAFRSFHRVLRDGGRFSLFEPINQFPRGKDHWRDWSQIEGLSAIVAKLRAVYEERQPRDDPMLDFDEHDLFTHAQRAGFSQIDLALEAKLEPPRPGIKWETMIRSSGNPKIPTLEEAMAQALTADERARFEASVRPQVEGGTGRPVSSAVAYLWAAR